MCYPNSLQTDLVACRVTQGFCSLFGHPSRHSDGRDSPWLSANNVGDSLRSSSMEETIQDKLGNLSGLSTPVLSRDVQRLVTDCKTTVVQKVRNGNPKGHLSYPVIPLITRT